jgi:hypothetical protein
MSDNLKLWHAVEKTPHEHTKPITGKSYNGNSPKPHYLVMKATETFGPCGIGWGFTVVDERIEDGLDGERMSIARVRVWYEWDGKRGEVEHVGGTPFCGKRSSGKPYMDEDAPKKSVTDALVKALSLIGFAGDIFMGRYDDSKYVAELRHEEREAKQQAAKPAAPKPPPVEPTTVRQMVDNLPPAPMGPDDAAADGDASLYRAAMFAALDSCERKEQVGALMEEQTNNLNWVMGLSHAVHQEIIAKANTRFQELRKQKVA